MLELDIPDYVRLQIKNLVCDFNGTLAVDGVLLPGVRGTLSVVARTVAIHVSTADTFGRARRELEDVLAQSIPWLLATGAVTGSCSQLPLWGSLFYWKRELHARPFSKLMFLCQAFIAH